MLSYASSFFAQSPYGSGDYSSSTYSDGTTTITSEGDGTLADTGMPIVLGGTIGTALVLCGIILLVKVRKNKRV